MEKLSILVVEDDALARKVMETHLAGHAVEFAHDKAGALRKLEAGKPDICFFDINLGKGGDLSGLELIPVAAAKGIYSVVMSGHDAEPMIERAYQLGCDDYYVKGNEERNVALVLERFSRKRQTLDPGVLFKDRFVTEDPATRAAVTEALKYAASELPVLILGPSGTGKTSLARVIHDHSGRQGEFVAINCSAYSEDLLEAELFGYRKGAFTGASDGRKGKLLAADGGTLFLDEIGSMSLKMQTKLLKAIEERTFYPLGSDKPETSRFRLVSATLEDLQALIRAGKLRFDFFSRIHGLTVSLKPLAERRCDILPLIAFLTRGGKKLAFSAEAKDAVMRHDWPGNIRELKRFVELLTAGNEGRVGLAAIAGLLKTIRVQDGAGAFLTDDQYRFALERGLDKAVERLVDAVIRRNLAENGGKKTKTLSDLGISTRLLYASLKRRGDSSREETLR